MLPHDQPRTVRLGSNDTTPLGLGRIAVGSEPRAQTLRCRDERGIGHGDAERLRSLDWMRAAIEAAARARDLAGHLLQDGAR